MFHLKKLNQSGFSLHLLFPFVAIAAVAGIGGELDNIWPYYEAAADITNHASGSLRDETTRAQIYVAHKNTV
jgi:hypothetical protein